jgi:putative molybdopterin biosynthesis protein
MAATSIEHLHKFEQIKLLADERRLKILRLLMSAPASLTQLGQALGKHPAWVRHHLKLLEQAGLVEIVEIRINSGVVEKFYQAISGGLLLQELILPEKGDHPAVVFSGSHDLAVELLAKKVGKHIDMLTLPVGSLDGLMTLRQGLCHLSGAHLLDKNGEYNTPFVQHIFPDRSMEIITLAYREQGLMTAPGNPKSIHGLADLAREAVTFSNRNAGSGTRLWLDRQLNEIGIPAQSIRGYENTVSTHLQSAQAVFSGQVDAALGLRAAAHQYDLEFIPLFHERYDLIFSEEQAKLLSPILNTLQSSVFHRSVEGLTGYETQHTGEQIPL